jgi:hypothetical protein
MENGEQMTYRHDFRILFSVPGSTDPTGMDLSGEVMLAALKARVAEFEANPQLLRDLAGAPQASVDQPLWVLRRIGAPGVIRQSDGGWIDAAPGGIRPEDMLPPEVAATFPAGRGAFWCRVEDALGEEVLAELHSDDRVIETSVDIRPWLAEAHPGDIAALAADGWGYAESADAVAQHLEGIGDPGAARLFGYLALNPKMSFTGDQVGFGLVAPETESLAWLRAHRPDVIKAMAIYADAALEP